MDLSLPITFCRCYCRWTSGRRTANGRGGGAHEVRRDAMTESDFVIQDGEETASFFLRTEYLTLTKI